MNNIERRNKNLAYIADDDVIEEIKRCRTILHKLNTTPLADFETIKKLTDELFGYASGTFLNPPFYCDFGKHIKVGKNLFINYNCTFLDVAEIKIGDNCFFAPNVSIYTAGHPIHPYARNSGYEYGKPVVIGDNVWVGGNVVICPGVTIGSNVVIGAGSVVCSDIPDWSVAVGNPCRVIKKITDNDKWKLFKDEQIDAEAILLIEEKYNKI